MANTRKTNKTRVVACHGCGRHAREVDDRVIVWFCNHCFLENGNLLRYKSDLPMVKPIENLRVKDHVIGANNEEYIITGKGEWICGDKYFPVKNLKTKQESFAGDFFFVQKVNK